MPSEVEGERELSAVSFIRALTTIMRVPSSCPDHLPKALLPNTIVVGVRISKHELWGHTNIFLKTFQFGEICITIKDFIKS